MKQRLEGLHSVPGVQSVSIRSSCFSSFCFLWTCSPVIHDYPHEPISFSSI